MSVLPIAAYRRCAAPLCHVTIPGTRLMCCGHWAAVPRALRDRLTVTQARYQSGAATLAELRLAEVACVRALTRRGGRRVPVKGGAA